jgi:REP element-mobilizing transposase RayT
LVGLVTRRLTELLTETCGEKGGEIMGPEALPAHILLFLGTGVDVSPAQVMHAPEGYMPQVLQEELPK